MKMQTKIIDYVEKFVNLTDEEKTELVLAFKSVKVKKRQLIIQPDFITKHRNYVVKGAFRAYVVNDEGQDITIQFAIEDWWISDYVSFLLQEPATMFVIALEDSVLLQLNYEEEQKLKKASHNFETFFRIHAERAAVLLQIRIILNLTCSAEERYEKFIGKYPEIAQRVPQYALASYLGITTQFLSKIRSQRMKKGKS
jgi:CRP-like cAMP-binding protein